MGSWKGMQGDRRKRTYMYAVSNDKDENKLATAWTDLSYNKNC